MIMISDVDKRIKEHIKDRQPVTIIYNDEAGDWQWSLDVDCDPGFWLTSFKTREKAIAFCKKKKLPFRFKDSPDDSLPFQAPKTESKPTQEHVLCKKVWLALGLGDEDQRGPTTFKELEPCLLGFKQRVSDAEQDTKRIHDKYVQAAYPETCKGTLFLATKELLYACDSDGGLEWRKKLERQDKINKALENLREACK